jgi:hypothetical protein
VNPKYSSTFKPLQNPTAQNPQFPHNNVQASLGSMCMPAWFATSRYYISAISSVRTVPLGASCSGWAAPSASIPPKPCNPAAAGQFSFLGKCCSRMDSRSTGCESAGAPEDHTPKQAHFSTPCMQPQQPIWAKVARGDCRAGGNSCSCSRHLCMTWADLVGRHIEHDADSGVEWLRRPDARVLISTACHVLLCGEHHPVAPCIIWRMHH